MCVFFFKQKTAYEMRISDWSSDVCSSDLISDLPALEVDAGIDDGVHDVADDVHQQAEQREEVERAEHDRIVPVQRGLEAEEAEEIGRASCRERVCPYV